jgi:hypothetical protein
MHAAKRAFPPIEGDIALGHVSFQAVTGKFIFTEAPAEEAALITGRFYVNDISAF